MRAPNIIGEKALVTDHLVDALKEQGIEFVNEHAIMRLVAKSFVGGYQICVERFDLMQQLLHLRLFDTESFPGLSFRATVARLRKFQLYDLLEMAPTTNVINLRNSEVWTRCLASRVFEGATGAGEGNDIKHVCKILEDPIKEGAHRQWNRRAETMSIGIITALPEEWLAVNIAFGAIEMPTRRDDPNYYSIAELRGTFNENVVTKVYITFLPRMGTNSAAVASTNLLRSFPEVSELIFCGIACACPRPEDGDKHVRLGDIVVTDGRGIVQIDHQAIKNGVEINRSNLSTPSRNMMNSVRLLASDELGDKRLWEDYLGEIIRNNVRFKRPDRTADQLLDGSGNRVRHPIDRHRRSGAPKIWLN